MPVPQPNFAPAFNILRCSHAVLTVADLGRSRAFYEETLGFKVEDATSDGLWLRGMEERGHHSLVLKRATEAACERMAFKLGSEEDLERAVVFFRAQDLPAAFVEVAHQGRTLHATDPFGMPLEFFHAMEQRERILQKYEHYRGVQPQRLDHFNVFADDVEACIDFYNGLGFRLTEYTETEDETPKTVAAWMHRKGGVHDIAFTNGRGPRLHHIAYWVPNALNIIHLCDVMSTTGYLANLERGPGRHGISNAFFLYIRDPDGHRTEIYTCDYLTVDTDLEPIRWSLRDPQRQTLWGAAAPRSWFEEGSLFPGLEPREAKVVAQPIVAR